MGDSAWRSSSETLQRGGDIPSTFPKQWDGSREVTRRQVLVGLGSTFAGALLLNACGGGTGDDSDQAGLSSLSTQLTYILDVTFAGWYLADEEGFLREEGVASKLFPYGANVPVTSAVVAGGRADIGLGAIREVIEANDQGADLVVFGTQFQKSPGGLLSLAENPIRTIEDVLGKRIGLDPSAQATLDVALDNSDLPHEYEVVNVSGDPQPLVDGRVDAMAVFVTSQPITLDLRGVENVAVTFHDLGFPSYENVLITKRETFDQRRDDLTGYLRAIIKGWELNRSDPVEGARRTVALHGEDNALDLEQQTAENKSQLPLMESAVTREKGLFQMSLEDLEGPQYEALRRAGVEPLPPVESFVSLEILNDAYDGRPSLLD